MKIFEKKYWGNLLAPLIINTVCYCQPMTAVKQLRVGDTLPDVEFNNVINQPANKLRFSDYKGKLVILDFWSHICISCMKAFPYMDSLQQAFKDKIQVIMVNQESMELTSAFFAKKIRIKKPSLPMITGDTLLKKFFPHQGVPFHVWIDSNGVIVHIPDSRYTSFENVAQFINGKNPDLPARINSIYRETLFDKDWETLPEIFSYIFKCRPGLHLEPKKQKGVEKITCGCVGVVQLYQTAFDVLTGNKHGFYDRPFLSLVESKDSALYNLSISERRPPWMDRYEYSYQLQLPTDKKDDLFPIMKEDLDRYFNVDVKMEKRSIACLVLLRTSKIDKLRSVHKTKMDTFDGTPIFATKYDTLRCLYDQPFSKLSFGLKYFVEAYCSKPFIDETGYTGNIDIVVNGETLDSFSLENLRKELKRYDLNIVEKKLERMVLVFKKRDDQGSHPLRTRK